MESDLQAESRFIASMRTEVTMSQRMQLDRERALRVSTDRRSDGGRRAGIALEHRDAPPRTAYVSRGLACAAVRRYDGVAQSLHWIIAAVIGVQLILGMVAWQFPHAKPAVLPIHKWVGITLGILAIARLVWRLRHAPPSLPVSMNPFERFSAKGAHAALQVLTLLLPLTGWALLSAPDHVIKVAGLFMPALLESQSPLRQLRNVHGFLAASLTLIVLLHSAAALRHHFWLRDDILVRMLPRRRTVVAHDAKIPLDRRLARGKQT
jgi:cytochrome b561